MLISFSVRNYRTFRERVEWSLIASADKTREDDNVVDLPQFGLRLLKSAVVYGANASGKSKLVEAMSYMRKFVATSSKNGQVGTPTNVEPFRLNILSAQAFSEFEIQFIYHNEMYRYGFEVSSTHVESEWLFLRSAKGIRKKQEIELFYRNGQDITFNARQFGGIVGELVKNAAIRENALVLSVAAQFNQSKAVGMMNWFISELLILSGLDEDWERVFTYLRLHYPDSKQEVLNFLASADLDIEDVRQSGQPLMSLETEEEASATMNKIRKWSKQEHGNVKTVHRVYDNDRASAEEIEFSLLKDESAGTQRAVTLAGPILETIGKGTTLIIDELDARLHPNLSAKIVQLFNSKETNSNNAQLLFNTHDTNLLTSGNFRRDQIWFTEKNRYGEATLYSLADFKTDKVRKDENFEANYVQGKYGAVPYLGDFNALPKAAPATKTAPPHEQPE